jgi:hypothetical protein
MWESVLNCWLQEEVGQRAAAAAAAEDNTHFLALCKLPDFAGPAYSAAAVAVDVVSAFSAEICKGTTS